MEKSILFDTGCSGPDLVYNMKQLNFSPKDVDILFLSHQHWDHIGGLFEVLELNKKIEVFVLKSFSKNLKDEISKRAILKEIEREQEIIKDIYTTGLIRNNPDEQSLILKTIKGIIVITGCSHPGVDKILDIARKHGEIYTIIGGFHEFSEFELLKGIEVIGACHCTKYKEKIKENFSKQFKEIKAGIL
jgi:7,8-dihydropterin-6-yl-methyl-4-(beta-D-ribofuranosyl)aminobenzene 5'-phosphate synthase